MFCRLIPDAYHGDDLDVALLSNNGPVALILKATQGISYVDPQFASRIIQARDNGLLTGSYHFADGSDPRQQVAHWLGVVQPRANEVIAFDWENNPSGRTMSYAQACVFVQAVKDALGRWPMIYGSNLLKENIPAGAGNSILFNCPLWLASYTTVPTLPRGWTEYALWQYTGDDANAKITPHTFPGANAPLDISEFPGTVAQLRNRWPF